LSQIPKKDLDVAAVVVNGHRMISLVGEQRSELGNQNTVIVGHGNLLD
jgi:hypothetical protein